MKFKITKEKIEFFGFIIRTSSSLRKKIENCEFDDSRNIAIKYYLWGIYDSRFLGLVFYRFKNSCEFPSSI